MTEQTDAMRRAATVARRAEFHFPADQLAGAADWVDALLERIERLESVIRALDVSIAHPDMGGSHQARAGERPRLTPEQWRVVMDAREGDE